MRKSGLFVIEAGIFGDEIIVAYNLSPKEILAEVQKRVKRKMFVKQTIKFIQQMSKDIKNDAQYKDKGYVYDLGPRVILVLNSWNGLWENYETLLHECVHVMQSLKERKRFNDGETEAYTVEYLFRTIRAYLPVHK